MDTPTQQIDPPSDNDNVSDINEEKRDKESSDILAKTDLHRDKQEA